MRSRYLVAILAGVAACSAPKTPSLSVEEMLADPAAMQAVLDRCEANPGLAATDLECKNAHVAIERKLAAADTERAAKQQAEFERLRAEKRAADDRRQQEAESKKKPFDPYSTPVNPDPAPQKP
jgi:hypothetical protein